jgi:IclR family transcriptional regulator, KDG regulon repressor
MAVQQEKKVVQFKRVPALDKCFRILEFLAHSQTALGITEISTPLQLNKSTVFNLIYTLVDLGILETVPGNKVRLGLKLYDLSRESKAGGLFISKVRPFLEEINRKTKLSVFLGLRSSLKAVIMDKVDSPHDIKISSAKGMQIPLIAGSHGKALLSLLPEDQLNEILAEKNLKPFTAHTCTRPHLYKQMVQKAATDRFALDDEEYLEGIRSLAIPLDLGRPDVQAAIWVVGLKSQIPDGLIPEVKKCLKETGRKIATLFSRTRGGYYETA